MPKVDAPTVRQAAEMMPHGPDRDALFARAGQIYATGPGPFIERRIAAVQRSLEMIWAAQEAQRKDNPAQPPAHAREHLRYENQLDRLYRSHQALWEQAFQSAREDVFRVTGKRLAAPIYEVDENWHDMKERLHHDAYYAKHRPGFEAGLKASAKPTADTPRTAAPVQKPEPAPVTTSSVRELAAGIDRLLKEVKDGRPKPIDAA
jgi:hypothetical protein